MEYYFIHVDLHKDYQIHCRVERQGIKKDRTHLFDLTRSQNARKRPLHLRQQIPLPRFQAHRGQHGLNTGALHRKSL